jgi:hypothetical protein
MHTHRKMRDQRRISKRRPVARMPISSHPETEEEIERFGCALDESRLKIDTRCPTPKAIVSVDGCDVKDKPIRKDRAA